MTILYQNLKKDTGKTFYYLVGPPLALMTAAHLQDKLTIKLFNLYLMGNHDPTTSMFHCWLDAIFHKFLPCHPPDVHSSITPMQTKPGLITKNGLGPLFSCPILVGSCKLQSSLLVSRCEVWLLSRHAANVVQPLLATPSRGGSRHTGTRLKLHLCLYL